MSGRERERSTSFPKGSQGEFSPFGMEGRKFALGRRRKRGSAGAVSSLRLCKLSEIDNGGMHSRPIEKCEGLRSSKMIDMNLSNTPPIFSETRDFICSDIFPKLYQDVSEVLRTQAERNSSREYGKLVLGMRARRMSTDTTMDILLKFLNA